MKKMMIALMAVLITVALAGIGTYAYFSDTANLSNTTFTAASMDLRIDNDPLSNQQNWVDNYATGVIIGGLYPGYPMKAEHNWQVIDIKNQGTVDGIARISLVKTSAWSDLCANLEFTVSYDADNNGSFETPVASGTIDEFSGNYVLGPLAGNAIGSIKIEWSVPTSAGNEITNDSVTVDAIFTLGQV